MRILNLTAGTHNNWGDALITAVMSERFSALGVSITQLDIAGGSKPIDPDLPFFRAKCEAQRLGRRAKRVLSGDPKKFLFRNLGGDDFDAVVVGGGQLLGDGFVQKLTQWFSDARLEKATRVFFSVGTSPEHGDKVSRCLAELERRDAFCFPRDVGTAATLREYPGFTVRNPMPDVAYAMKVTNEQRQNKCVVICPVAFERLKHYKPDFFSWREYSDWWFRIALEQDCPDSRIVVLPSAVVDVNTARKLSRELKQRGLDATLVWPRSLKACLRVLSAASVVVSARMHPLIIGDVLGCRIVPFIRNEKLQRFAEGLKSGCSRDEKRKDVEARFAEALDLVSERQRPAAAR